RRLAPIGDLERLTNRIHAGVAGPRDLTGLRTLLRALPDLQARFANDAPAGAADLGQGFDPCAEVREELERALVDDPPATMAQAGLIRPGYSAPLDEVVESGRQAREWIANLEPAERGRTGIKSLKVGYNKIFGYYIEVTKANSSLVPADYIRKQTLVNGERYLTPQMKEYEAIVLTVEERQRASEAGLFRDLCRRVGGESQRLLATAQTLAELDVVTALAEVAARKGYVRPEIGEDDRLEILDGRHPVVEELLTDARFVPNDAMLEQGERIRVITGPNMSGKSTYLRQAALIVLMAQMGSFVPARAARLGIVDRIFTRIGAQDEIHAGRSTFMVEMVEAAHILHHATRRSLLVLDEIGRGTSTYDGLSLAWAVLEYIHNHPRVRARTLFATHFHELTRLSQILPGVRNYNVAVTEEGGRVVFLHRIVPGGTDKSYGIHVAELAGLPRPVVNRAREILAQLEADAGEVRAGAAAPARQLRLFPEANPLLDELRRLDLAELSPLEALNLLFEWQRRFAQDGDDTGGPSQGGRT
ncbi:MAG: DNA mismatch repair protein MutS, partial [Anaerolineales bacterium]